jgi:hypothetical protein
MAKRLKLIDSVKNNDQKIIYEGTEEEKQDLERLANEIPIYCLTEGKTIEINEQGAGIVMRFEKPEVEGIEKAVHIRPLTSEHRYYILGCFNDGESGWIDDPSVRFVYWHPYCYARLVWEKSSSEKYEISFNGIH